MIEGGLGAPSSWSTKLALSRFHDLKAYLTGRFGAAPGDSESGRAAFWLCSSGPSCEVAFRLAPSRTDGVGKTPEVAPDETGARSVAILASSGDWSCAKLG